MTTLFEIIRCATSGTELHGLGLRSPKPAGCLFHFHGTGGNFYSNPFVEPIGVIASSLAISYFTVNLPGHDETSETERFEECISAIDSWIDAIAPLDCPIFLQGHSLGALKILHYMNSPAAKNRDRVQSLILLSPFDIVAFYCKGKPEDVDAIRAQVESAMQSGGPASRVSSILFDLWPISAGTFLDLVRPSGPADTFPSRSSLRNSPLASIKLPTLVAIGTEDFAAFPSPSQVVAELKELGNSIESHLVAQAPHNFAGQTHALSELVGGWLRSQME